ncbi:iron ABC transporter permease [Deinococcus psychrotolerans]|uniref:Iron ABC transporter permease n=1 Tax=Deinococcus psychrotolerans TaxID=2489213 RepID=A0A3G8YEK9_9DEIO|nr:iron ABC transporter permease [Deinococcus psychrotolerans]AZI43752.1 iron ABC transporter permease [Deinococcus psychrotolerans]
MRVGGINLSIWREPYFLGRLGWTLSQAGLTVLLGAAIAWPLAYLLSRYALRGKLGLLRLLLLPFVTPTLVAVLGLTALLGPRGWITQLTGLDLSDSPALIILGNLFFNLPIMLRLAYGGFARVPPSLTGAARTLGASHWQAALTVALPLALPGLAAGAILVFLYSALSFGLPLTLGGEKYATLEVEIYTLTAYELRLPEASALILGQLVVTLAATLIYTRLTTGAVTSAARTLPGARGAAALALFSLLALTLLICFSPLLAVVIRSFSGVGGPTLAFWRGLVSPDNDPPLSLMLYNTLRFAGFTLLGAVVLGASHALGAYLSRSRSLDALSLLPLMLSPVSVGVGYLLTYPAWAAQLGLLIAAYTLIASPLITRSLLPALRALPLRALEAARTLGASPLMASRTVALPLIWPALRGGAALSLATVLGEFGATLVLTRPEWATLSTGLYERLGRPGAQNLGEACALATILLGLALGAFTVLDGGEGEVA